MAWPKDYEQMGCLPSLCLASSRIQFSVHTGVSTVIFTIVFLSVWSDRTRVRVSLAERKHFRPSVWRKSRMWFGNSHMSLLTELQAKIVSHQRTRPASEYRRAAERSVHREYVCTPVRNPAASGRRARQLHPGTVQGCA